MTRLERSLIAGGLVVCVFIVLISMPIEKHRRPSNPFDYLQQFKKSDARFPIHIEGLDLRTAIRTQRLLYRMPPGLRRSVVIWAGYRSDDLQAEIIRAAYKETHPRLIGKRLDRAIMRGYSHPRNGKAAAPGKSRHRLGHAIDIRGPRPAMAWLHKNAPRFGLVNPPSIRHRDPWHFELK